MFVKSILYVGMRIPLSNVVREAFSYAIEGARTLSPLNFCVANTSSLNTRPFWGKSRREKEKGRQGQLPPLPLKSLLPLTPKEGLIVRL